MKKQLRSISILFIILVWVGFICPVLSYAQSQASIYSDAITAFGKFVERQMALDKVPGLSIGFMKDDFIWSKGFGYSDLENMTPAKPENSYRLASVTKTLTAIAVLQLVEAGKIDLDAEVQTYVPYFPKKKWPVTVRLLLGHLGGISHYKNYNLEGHIKVHKNTKEALAIFQDFDLVAKPGTRFHYSSYGYNLLGAVIEDASGQSYGQYIKKHIFEPLGMENSRMDDPVELIPNRIRGYRLINGEIKNSEYVDVSSRFAGGGTRSTVVDLLKYAKGIIEGKLLKKETWNQMFSSIATSGGFFTGYGMGWRVSPWKGHFQVNHSGSQPETRTYLLIFPTEKFAIAMASNREGLDLMPYIRRLAELLLDEDIDSATYVQYKEGQIIHDACFRIFSYGMSRFDWFGRHAANGEKDLAKAFSYFNQHVSKKALKNKFIDTKKKIDAGIHPASNQAFTKVGTFIAFALNEALGKERLKSYYKTGPLSFFSDYIKISNNWNSDKRKYKFKKNFTKLISSWEKDWSTVYTDYVRSLFITINTDFDELGSKLGQTFSGAEVYPDFSRNMARVAQYFLEKDELEKSFKILNLNVDLYPNSPAPLSSLAGAYLWTGNAKSARSLFRKAFAMNPAHSSVSLNEFYNLAKRLSTAKKMKGLFALAEITTELFPKNARLYKIMADMYLQSGQKEKAIDYYKKALTINPKYKEAREKLEKLKKEKQK